jgi:hypothetical protein
MKDIEQQEEIYFKELMSGSRLEMPFSDFEENVMMEIERRFIRENFLAREIKLSWVFFIAGSVFGTLISWILLGMDQKILGIDTKYLAVCFQMFFIVVLFTQLETLMGFLKKNSFKSYKI